MRLDGSEHRGVDWHAAPLQPAGPVSELAVRNCPIHPEEEMRSQPIRRIASQPLGDALGCRPLPEAAGVVELRRQQPGQVIDKLLGIAGDAGVQPGGTAHAVEIDHHPAAIGGCDGWDLSGGWISMEKTASAAQIGLRQRRASDDEGVRVPLQPPQQAGQLNDVAGFSRIEGEPALVAIARLSYPTISGRREALGCDQAGRGAQDREPAGCRRGGALRRGRLHA